MHFHHVSVSFLTSQVVWNIVVHVSPLVFQVLVGPATQHLRIDAAFQDGPPVAHSKLSCRSFQGSEKWEQRISEKNEEEERRNPYVISSSDQGTLFLRVSPNTVVELWNRPVIGSGSATSDAIFQFEKRKKIKEGEKEKNEIFS